MCTLKCRSKLFNEKKNVSSDSNSMVPDWNKLPRHVTSVLSINAFKARLDKRNNTVAIVQTGCHRLKIST